MPPEVCHDKEKIAVFFLDLPLGQAVLRLYQFGGFFGQLVQHLSGRGPVKSDAGRAFLQFERAQQGGQADGHTVQGAALRFSRPFRRLDRLPVRCLLGGGFVPAFVAKNMRMPRHHLVGNRGHHGLKGEMPGLFAHGRVIDRLQEQIAQLPLQLREIAPLDRIGNFVSLFNGVGGDGVEILLDIPGAARFRIAQAAHDLQQALNSRIRVVDQVFSHCSVPICRVTCT